jgi:NADH-ubiquinone oxidoreductase chain 6
MKKLFTLFSLLDLFINGYKTEIIDFFYFFSIILCINTIISKNPIVSILYLISLFSVIACYLIYIGIDFIGISYLLVYVGAVSILFIFILMLINIRVSELLTETNNSLPLSILSVLPFLYIIGKTIPNINFKDKELINLFKDNEYFFNSIQEIFFVSGNN